MKKKWLCRILSFYEKEIDTTQEPIGFRKLQRKRKHQERSATRKTREHYYITYKTILNLSTGEQDQNREREETKGKNKLP